MGQRNMAVLLCGAWLVACTGSRTGNPNAPEYESSSRFAPDPTGGISTGHGGEGLPYNPAVFRSGGDFAAFFDHYLALVAPERGLLVIDVADPETPTLAGELPLHGNVYQLHADATGVTLAILERVDVDEGSIPDTRLTNEQFRLVRVDITDPMRPRRTFDVDLDGVFWELTAHGKNYFVIEQLFERDDAICASNLQLPEEAPPVHAMKIVHYELTASAFVEREAVELPTELGLALTAGDTYLVMFGDQSETGSLRWVDFAGGTLVEGGPLGFEGRPVSADREGETLAILAERDDGAVVLALYTLDNAGTARTRGNVTLPARDTSAVSLLASGAAIVDGDNALLVDLSDLDAPRLASQLPTDVTRLVETPTGLLGLGDSDGVPSNGSSGGGTLVVSLWDASALDAPMQLGRVTTEWCYSCADPGGARWMLDAARNRVLIPVSPENDLAPEKPSLAVFDLDPMSVSLHSEQAARVEVFRPLTDGESAFSTGYEGLEVFPLVAGAHEAEPVSAFLPYHEAAPIDRIEFGDQVLELWERETDGVFHVDVTPRGGGKTTTLELDHHGQELVAVGDRVVVIGLPWQAGECEALADQGLDPTEIADIVGPNSSGRPGACDALRARGVSVIALDGTPRIAGSAKITSAMDVEAIDRIEVRAQWLGYLVLEDGRLAFLAQRTQECRSHADCDRLGVPAYESFGSPGCNPQKQNCADLPAVETFVSGYKQTLGVYTLQDIDTDAPDLTLGAVLDGRFDVGSHDEGPLDLGPHVLSTQGGIALARQADVYNDEGNSVPNEHGDPIVRFFLDRVVLNDDGSLEASPPVNTPGRPVALDGDAVYCLEPRYVGDEITVQLHRATLRGAGAFIDASVDLGTGFLGTVTQGANLWVLRGIGDPCQPDAHAALFGVPLAATGELDKGKALDLPGGFWGFSGNVSSDEDTLFVRGGPHPLGWLVVDVSDPGKPEVKRYTTTALE